MYSHQLLCALTLGALALAQGSPLSAQHHLYTFDGDAGYDDLGSCVDNAGDVNGDGYDDVLVGAYQVSGGGTGYARVFSGRNGALLFEVKGDGAADSFGISAGAGDVNRDGYDDIIVGASQEFC